MYNLPFVPMLRLSSLKRMIFLQRVFPVLIRKTRGNRLQELNRLFFLLFVFYFIRSLTNFVLT